MLGVPMSNHDYQVRHLDLSDGLDNMRVFSILQDRDDDVDCH